METTIGTKGVFGLGFRVEGLRFRVRGFGVVA